MADRLPPLDLLLAFEAVARQGSITRGAAERFVTQSAMSRQIQALEAELGVALFERRHRALALTEAGQRLLAGCSTALAQLRETVRGVRAAPVRAQIALTTTPSFAALWLIPRLSAFTREHPGLDVRLDASFERRDLVRDGFDLAVRYGPVNRGEGQRLFGEAVVPVCSPDLVGRFGASLAATDALAEHTLLQVGGEQGRAMPLEWESWLQRPGAPPVQPRAMLTFSSYNEAIAAAVAGQGVALGRRPLIDRLLRERRLVVPFGRATATERAYFVLLAPGAAPRPAAQALVDWMLAEAGAVAQA